MNTTPETLEQISRFRNVLVLAFSKMIRGINVELSEKGKERLKFLVDIKLNEPFFIEAIYENESLQLKNRSQQIIYVMLSDINL
jgi:hypothetical protein